MVNSNAHALAFAWSGQQALAQSDEEVWISEGLPQRKVLQSTPCRVAVPPVSLPHVGARRTSLPNANAYEQQSGLPSLLTSQALEQLTRAKHKGKLRAKVSHNKENTSNTWSVMSFWSCVDPTDDLEDSDEEELYSPWTSRAIIWDQGHHSCSSNEGSPPSRKLRPGNSREYERSCDTSHLSGPRVADVLLDREAEEKTRVQQLSNRTEGAETWMSWFNNLFR